jgi:hypothetical protein
VRVFICYDAYTLLIPNRKFIGKFGRHAFVEYYLPLHNIFGEHLPGRQFVWSDEQGQKKKRRKSKTKPKVAGAAGALDNVDP